MADSDSDSLGTALTAQPPNVPTYVQPQGVKAPSLLDSVFGLDRNALNANVVAGQQRNGLLSAQTQLAISGAKDKQDEAIARTQIGPAMQQLTGDENIGKVMDALARSGQIQQAHQLMQSLTELNKYKAQQTQLDPTQIGTPAAKAAFGMTENKDPSAPQTLPNNYYVPAQGNAPPIVPQQSPQGAAQTAQTKAVTGEDIARAEEAHANAKLKASGLQGGGMTPESLDTASDVVMADPNRMRDYASFGQQGQAVRQAINNEIARKLTAAGMSPTDLITHRAIAHASVGAAGAAAKQEQVMDAFQPLVDNNGQRILELIHKIDPSETGLPVLDGVQRAVQRGTIDQGDLAELHQIFTTYQGEVARLVNSNPNMTGVVSDHSRGKVESMAPENMNAQQAEQVINRVHTEMQIRRQAIQASLMKEAQAQGPVTGGNGGAAPAASPTGAPGAADPLGIR